MRRLRMILKMIELNQIQGYRYGKGYMLKTDENAIM